MVTVVSQNTVYQSVEDRGAAVASVWRKASTSRRSAWTSFSGGSFR
jgi:hypothetical protein